MHDDPNKNLSDAESKALRALAGEPEPSPQLEDRLMADLKRRGAIRADGGWIMKVSKTFVAAIVVAAAFVGGFVMGGRGETATPPVEVAAPSGDAPQYMLLMFTRVAPSPSAESQPREPADGGESYRAIVAEYRQWAIDRENEGRLVSAEKLAADTRVMTGRGSDLRIASSANTDRMLGGYFLITAPSLDAAIELAKTHPHLKYGGEVEVRPIENTR